MIYMFLSAFNSLDLMYVNRLSALAKSGMLENEGIRFPNAEALVHWILDVLHRARELFPDLQQKGLVKGDCGRVGIIGGSAEYTGASFFAAMTVLHCVCFKLVLLLIV